MKHSSALTAEGLSAGYARRDIVDIPALTLRAGEVAVLLGPNAAGKSTLLYRISARARASHLAFVGQEAQEGFAFTVRELVALGAEAHEVRGRPASARIENALAQMEITELAARDLLHLSGGERQRAAIARALAQETALLLLDEPTAHLDLRHQAALMDAARRAARDRGAAVLIVLHDLNLASAYADRLILLAEGRLAADGPPSAVLTQETIARVYRTSAFEIAGHQNRPAVYVAPQHQNLSQ
jgi:iron complex transport system ATP-binding protein